MIWYIHTYIPTYVWGESQESAAALPVTTPSQYKYYNARQTTKRCEVAVNTDVTFHSQEDLGIRAIILWFVFWKRLILLVLLLHPCYIVVGPFVHGIWIELGIVEKVANNTVIDCWIITSAEDEEEVEVVVFVGTICIDKDNNTSSTTVKEIDGNYYYFCQVNEWVQSEQRVLKHIEKATTSTTTTVTCVAFECPCS